MKKTILIIAAFIAGLTSIGQPKPNNVDAALFPNGALGSNGGTAADLAIALRIKPTGLSYTAVPAAEDFTVYLRLPAADFTISDMIVDIQNNVAIMGATGTMTFQGIFDVGDPGYLWAGLSLNASGGMNLSSLSAVTNAWAYTTTLDFVGKTPAQIAGVRIVDQVNGAFVGANSVLLMSSQNQLTAVAFAFLPVDLLSFSGYKDGNKNQLRWVTSFEQNNKGFEVQRSLDGINYSTISFVNSLAPGGFSQTQLNYAYTDNNVTGLKQFYRLRQIDFDGRSKISNIVLLKSDKPAIITIDGMFPNPASSTVNLMIASPVKDKVSLVMIDLSGKIVLMQSLNVETGSNTLPVNVSSLAGGTYIVRLISSTGDVSTAKLVKQ